MKTKLLRIAGMALVLALSIASSPAWLGSSVSAQRQGTVLGNVKDESGKPMEGISIIIEPDGGGVAITATTDSNGHFVKQGIPAGSYVVTYKQGETLLFKIKANVALGKETDASLNLGDPKIAEYMARVKKENEEMAKFGKLKLHFDAGTAALAQATDLRTQLNKAPTAQKPDLKAKLDPVASQAISEFQEALKVIDEKDEANRVSVLTQLSLAYEAAGKYDEEAQTIQLVVAIKPDASLYNNLGNALAKGNKVDEARAAYLKSGELDPANMAEAYRNFGAVLFNLGRLSDPAVAEMLRKSTQLDPANAQGWFLLGVALVANITFKDEGGKMIPQLQPGTVEAYQKCIDLDPNGPLGEQARQGLQGLKEMGAGIDVKLKPKH